MPLFFEKTLNQHTKIGIWKIEEPERFFLQTVSLQQSIQHPHKRLQHLAGRFLLSWLIPHFPVASIEVNDSKKPILKDEAFQFSISHCGNFAAAIVSTTEKVGIDIELKTLKIERVAHKFLHSSEAAWIQKLAVNHHDQKILMLTTIWSAKEALFKWWGNGGVDFSEMMQLSAPAIDSDVILKGTFTKDAFSQNVDVHYRQFDDLMLCWVQTD